MKIEIISGSARANSVTRRVALHLKKYLGENSEHEVNLLDMHDWQLPALEKVFLNVESTPPAFRELSERVFAADAFVMVTPEYNGSYAPALKNLLDHFPKQSRKAFGIVTASTGAMGGMRATQQLLLLVPALFGVASSHLLLVPWVEKKFSEIGELLDPAFEKNVSVFSREFLWLAEQLCPVEKA